MGVGIRRSIRQGAQKLAAPKSGMRFPTLDVQVLDLVFNPVCLTWQEYQPGHFRGIVEVGRNKIPFGNTMKPFHMLGKFHDGRLVVMIRRDRRGKITQVRQIFGRSRRGWINKPLYEFSVPLTICPKE